MSRHALHFLASRSFTKPFARVPISQSSRSTIRLQSNPVVIQRHTSRWARLLRRCVEIGRRRRGDRFPLGGLSFQVRLRI